MSKLNRRIRKQESRSYKVLKYSIAFFAAVGLVVWFQSNSELDLARSEARAAGVPLGIEDLPAYDPLPLSLNSAPDYSNLKLIVDKTSFTNKGQGEDARGALSNFYEGFDENSLRLYLDELQPMLNSATLASRKPNCQIDFDFSDWENNLLLERRGAGLAVKALSGRARLSAYDEDYESALSDLETILKISEHISPLYGHVGFYAALSHRRTWATAGLWILSISGGDPQVCDGLLNQAEQFSFPKYTRTNLVFEAFINVQFAEDPYLLSGLGVESNCWGPVVPTPPTLYERAESALYNSSSVKNATLREALNHWTSIFKSFDKHNGDWEKFIAELERNDWFESEVEHDLLGGLVWAVDSRFWSMLDQISNIQIQDALLRSAIALHELKYSNGSFPSVLPTELQFHDKVGAGQLRYQLKGDGFVLYSIGRNLKDDGGPVTDENDSSNDDFGIIEPFVWHTPYAGMRTAGLRADWRPKQ